MLSMEFYVRIPTRGESTNSVATSVVISANKSLMVSESK